MHGAIAFVDAPEPVVPEPAAEVLAILSSAYVVLDSVGDVLRASPLAYSYGIVRASGVRSRYVTAIAGILLILIGLSPLARILNGIPPAVVGGTAVVVFAIIVIVYGSVIYFADTRMKTRDNSFSGFPG